ncbi:hypothetical protein Pan258_29300 [Symmachiella dynata]|uniref:hypothetical protein n=1 Tax=Symmachiella dynata TaxID=2527995 RepID=UPI00118AA8FB|nr:hypothetical protein [Symmachiella dynata]QDT48883.1 hypothetical protein Pan258_29300 [Symmachiella dynata]
MGRKRKTPIYGIVAAEFLHSVGIDGVLDIDDKPEESLFDEAYCPIADDVLIALRKTFSLTFPQNPLIEGLREAMTEIRRIGTEALSEISGLREELGLKSIPGFEENDDQYKVRVYKYLFVRTKDLKIKVKYEGRTHSLFTLFDPVPADGLVRTLREVVSDTFSEMHDEEQFDEVLMGIREKVWDVLPEINPTLFSIGLEPIAELAAGSEEEDNA